jgi:hypothetical protein
MSMTLDDALALLAPYSPEYAGALSDHAPMVLEALDRLGRGDLLETYLARTLPYRRLLSDEVDPALAAFSARVAAASYDVARWGWERALSVRLSPLVDAVSGAAFHGTIRVAHAVRALERADTEPRRVELCRALAYMEARAERLGLPRSGGPSSLTSVLEGLEPSPDAMARRHGLISAALSDRARAHATLATRVSQIALGDPRRGADELRAAALRLFLHGEYVPANTFTMLHAVTGMEAIGTLVRSTLPIDPEVARALVEHGGQALAAMRVAFVGRWHRPAPELHTRSRSDLQTRAVESLDDHAIKLCAALETMPELGQELGKDEHAEAMHAEAMDRWLVELDR